LQVTYNIAGMIKHRARMEKGVEVKNVIVGGRRSHGNLL